MYWNPEFHREFFNSGKKNSQCIGCGNYHFIPEPPKDENTQKNENLHEVLKRIIDK